MFLCCFQVLNLIRIWMLSNIQVFVGYFPVLNLMQVWMLSSIQVFLRYFPVFNIRPTDRPPDWPPDQPTDQPTNRPTNWLPEWLTVQPIDQPNDWPTDRLTNQLTDWPTDQHAIQHRYHRVQDKQERCFCIIFGFWKWCLINAIKHTKEFSINIIFYVHMNSVPKNSQRNSVPDISLST